MCPRLNFAGENVGRFGFPFYRGADPFVPGATPAPLPLGRSVSVDVPPAGDRSPGR
ncbi:MAG: hypothetical protein JWL69_3652 [Phycisphaerales bacterium]|nr:hypothetical protein [Phycisphaerales bacterium]